MSRQHVVVIKHLDGVLLGVLSGVVAGTLITLVVLALGGF